MPYTPHLTFPLHVDDSTKIWRFIDIPKFLALLEYKSLFFSRVDKLIDDPWEGHIPRPTPVTNITHLEFNKATQDIDVHKFTDQLTPDIEKSHRDISLKQRKYAFVNCWNISNVESNNLWRIYSKKGVAIQSTVGNLKKCFENETEFNVYIFQVKYVDYDTESSGFVGSAFLPLIHKRIQFTDERELRAIVWFPPVEKYSKYETKDGLDVKVELNKLIQNVYLSSDSPNWYLDLFKRIIKKYDLDKNLIKSKIGETP